MPVSADELVISIAPETTYGVLPTTGWHQLPIVSEGLVPVAETVLSNLLNPQRQVVDSILNNLSAEGDLASEMVICPAFEIILESAMCSTATAGTPAVGDPTNLKTIKVAALKKSFSIEKRFPDPSGIADKYLYQVITGCVVNTFGAVVSPSDPVTWNAGLLGKDFIEYTTDRNPNTIVPAANPTPVTNVTVLRAPDVVDLQFGKGSLDGEDITARCFGDFAYTINNNFRGIQCIGTLGNKHVVLGRCEVAGSATIHLKDNLLLEALLAQSEHDLYFRVVSDDGETPVAIVNGLFDTLFERIKLATNGAVAGGTGTDVVNDMTFNALYSATDLSTLTIGWGDGAAVQPV